MKFGIDILWLEVTASFYLPPPPNISVEAVEILDVEVPKKLV